MFSPPTDFPLLPHVCPVPQSLHYTGKVVTLRGHDGAIVCMAACRPYSMVVTGSSDRTCIIWDTNRSVSMQLALWYILRRMQSICGASATTTCA